MSLLEIKGLRVLYGKAIALNGMNIQLDSGELVGVVSQRDLLKASLSNVMGLPAEEQSLFLEGVSISEVMSAPPVTIAADSSMQEAAKLMSDAEHEGELSGRGQWVLLRVIPALSGLAVVTLGGLISANYLYRIETGRALFGWLG